jgi:glucans biosynthesis protein C
LSERNRIYYLDWLRFLTIVVVFYFHNFHIFSTLKWFIKNDETSLFFTFLVGFINFWMMPMFFFISGASSSLAYRVRSPAKYVTERFNRLIIPFFLGVIILTPPINYFHELSINTYSDSFWNYMPIHVQNILCFKSFSPMIFSLIGAHAWYLAYLFIFSLITIPIFKYLSSNGGNQFIRRLLIISNKPGMILLYFLPLALSNIFLKGSFPKYTDWSDFTLWLSIFILGFILFSQQAFENTLKKNIIISFCSGSISFIIIGLLLQTSIGDSWHKFPDYSPGSFFFQTLWTFTTCLGLFSLQAWE